MFNYGYFAAFVGVGLLLFSATEAQLGNTTCKDPTPVNVSSDDLKVGGLSCNFTSAVNQTVNKWICSPAASCGRSGDVGSAGLTQSPQPLAITSNQTCQCCQAASGDWEYFPVTCWTGDNILPSLNLSYAVYHIRECQCGSCGGSGQAQPPNVVSASSISPGIVFLSTMSIMASTSQTTTAGSTTPVVAPTSSTTSATSPTGGSIVTTWPSSSASSSPSASSTTTTTTNSIRTRKSTTPIASVPIVNIPSLGRIRGLRRQLLPDDSSVDAFLGIPYAKPPVGDLRFQAPVPYDGKWTDKDFDASTLPAACYQPTNYTSALARQNCEPPRTQNLPFSEDCLYLNIWRPSATFDTPRSVVVWIYGVGFDSTFSNVNGYDGVIQALRGDVIVVTIQYRLGALGFLALDDTIAPGNSGLLDQQLALQWIHDHIAAFGGDPGSVTLVGESAGGTSVSLHLLSNGSSALFRSAVIQSRVATAPIAFYAVDQLRQSSRALADSFGCETKNRRQSISDLVTCLRGVSAADLIEKEWSININGPPFAPRFGPTVDGTFLTNTPGDLINAGRFQRKNILLGVNTDEAGCFQYGAYKLQGVYYGQNLTADGYKLMTNDVLSWANSGQMVAVNFEYTTACQTDGISSPNYFKAIDSIVNDYFFQCPVVNLALAYARQIQLEADTTNSVYFYKFAHRDTLSVSSTWANGALQGDELDFLFGRPWNPDFALNYTDRERTLSSKVIEFWTNFAKTGDPNLYDVNGDMQTSDEWPKYTANERLVLVLDTTDHLQTQMGLRDRECEFWTNVVPNLGAAQPKSEGARLVCRNSLVSILFVSISVVLRWFSRQ